MTRKNSGLVASVVTAVVLVLTFQNCSSFSAADLSQIANATSASTGVPGQVATPTPMATATPTAVATPTPTPGPTAIPSATATPTPTPTPVPSSTTFNGMPIQQSIYTAYGDSITSGTGASAYFATAYAPLLAADAGATMHNWAVPGMLSCNIAALGAFAHPAPQVSDGASYVTLMGGTNDSNVGDVGPAEINFNLCEQASVSWLAIPNTSKSLAQSSSCVKQGSWSIDSSKPDAEMVSHTQGDKMDCSITTSGGPAYFWYALADGNGGTFSYSVDGGSSVTVQSQSLVPMANGNGTEAAGVFVTRLTGLASGAHHVVFTVTSATSASNTVILFGVGTVPAAGAASGPHVFVGGVPYQRDDNRSAQTAKYNADVIANVNLLQGDGLPVHFVNVRNYLHGTSAEMQDTLHPNDTGHMNLKNAFEATIHP